MTSKHLGTILALGLLVVGVRAQQPLDLRVPSTLIAYFDRTTATGCPVGWTELTDARGAALVGLTNGGTKGTLVGTALTNQEDRTHTHTLAHDHTLSAHTHSFSGTTSGPSATIFVSEGLAHVGNYVHTHSYSSTTAGPSTANTGGSSAANTGTQSATIAPYLQLLICSKA